MRLIANRKTHEPNPPIIPTPIASTFNLTKRGSFLLCSHKYVLILSILLFSSVKSFKNPLLVDIRLQKEIYFEF